jgi:hypothetical protein
VFCLFRNLCSNSKMYGSKTCRLADKDLNSICYINRLASCASASVYSDVRSSRIEMSSLTPSLIEEPLHAAYSSSALTTRIVSNQLKAVRNGHAEHIYTCFHYW